MRLDARIKQIFPFVMACILALIAYFQALGLGHLLVAQLTSTTAEIPRRSQDKLTEPTSWTKESMDGSAILARNAFDSITGPLNGRENAENTNEHTALNTGNPYADPICESVRVLLITTAEDVSWSFAAIAIGKEKASLRRIGDQVGDRVVQAMTWDRVWMVKNETRCQLPLHAAFQDKPSASSTNPPLTTNGLPPDIANKIQKISDTQFNVDRTIIETIMERKNELLGSLRVSPGRDPNGAGMRLSGIRPNSLLNMLGLVNGDRLQTINGFDMSDPMVALQAYARLTSADKLDVRIIRAGKPTGIEINLR